MGVGGPHKTTREAVAEELAETSVDERVAAAKTHEEKVSILYQEMVTPDSDAFHPAINYVEHVYPHLFPQKDELLAAMSLIRSVPTDFDEACSTERRIKEFSGQRRFEELTGLKKLRCKLTADQKIALAQGQTVMPLTKDEYSMMATRMETKVMDTVNVHLRKKMKKKATHALRKLHQEQKK